jgi:WD40 repeat protein
MTVSRQSIGFRRLREALRSLELRATTAQRAKGLPWSRREAAKQANRRFHAGGLDARRIGEWVGEPGRTPRDTDKVWALVQVWAAWAGDSSQQRLYWNGLVQGAQPSPFRKQAPGRLGSDGSHWDNPTWWAQTTRSYESQDAFMPYWDARARGVENAQIPGWFFTGRQRALRVLIGWLSRAPDGADLPLRVVIGGPGSGKSALLARLVTLSDPEYRARLPQSLPPDDPVAGLHTGTVDVAIYARGLDGAQLLHAIASGVGCEIRDPDQLLAWIAKERRLRTIVVDGLDEATEPFEAAALLRYLAGNARDLDLRILVGTRPGAQSRLLRALGAEALRAAVDLDDPLYAEIRDLAEYVKQRLLLTGVSPDDIADRDTPFRGQEQVADQVAWAVARRAFPSFLVAALTSVGLVRAKATDVSWSGFPGSVSDAMNDYLDRFPHAKRRVIEDLIRPLAYSYGRGLPGDELWAELATYLAQPSKTYTVADIGWLIDSAGDYLLESFDEQGYPYYRLHHEALVDFVRENDVESLRSVDRIFFWLHRMAPKLDDGTRDWTRARPYIVNHLCDHAVETGQLGTLIDDAFYLVAANPMTLAARLRHPPFVRHPNALAYMTAVSSFDGNIHARLFELRLHSLRVGNTLLADALSHLPLKEAPRLEWANEERWTAHQVITHHPEGDSVVGLAAARVDDRQIIIGGGGNQLLVWDGEDGSIVSQADHPYVSVVTTAILQGLSVIISGGRTGEVRLWEAASRRPMGNPIAIGWPAVGAMAVALRDAKPVIAIGHHRPPIDLAGGSTESAGKQRWRGGTISIWDLSTGELVLGPLKGHGSDVVALAAAEIAGRSLIVSGCNVVMFPGGHGEIRIWDLMTGEQVGDALDTGSGGVSAVAVASVAGRHVIVAALTHAESGSDGVVRIYDFETRRVIATLSGHEGLIGALAMTEVTGRHFAVTGGFDGTVRTWDLSKLEQLGKARVGHVGEVVAVTVCEWSGRTVAMSGGTDGTVRLWDLDRDVPRADASRSSSVSDLVSMYAVNNRPAIAGVVRRTKWIDLRGDSTSVRAWNLHDGSVIKDVLRGDVSSLAVGKIDEELVLVVGGGTGSQRAVQIYDYQTGVPKGNRIHNPAWMQSVAVSNIGGRPVVVATYGDTELRVWDLTTAEPIGMPIVNSNPVVEVVAGRFGNRPVVVSSCHTPGDGRGVVQVWDLETREAIGGEIWTGQGSALASLAIGEFDGEHVIAGGGHGGDRVLVWRLRDGHLLYRLGAAPTRGAAHIALGEISCRGILVSGSDGSLSIWTEPSATPTIRIPINAVIRSVLIADNLIVAASTIGLIAIRPFG